MIAARNDDVKHYKLLLHQKAYIDFQDKNGWTALHHAAYGGSDKVIRMLLKDGKNCRYCSWLSYHNFILL